MARLASIEAPQRRFEVGPKVRVGQAPLSLGPRAIEALLVGQLLRVQIFST